MKPAGEATWREQMAEIIANPDEQSPGPVYLAMALRIEALESAIQSHRTAAKDAHARHRLSTAMCEWPHTCGGCHFYAGAIAALDKLLS